jgi:hypothetical protein
MIGDIIHHSFEILKESGVIVLLMPCDTLHKPTLLDAIEQPFHYRQRAILGRVAYIRNGKPVSGRQIYDSIFTLFRAGQCTQFLR